MCRLWKMETRLSVFVFILTFVLPFNDAYLPRMLNGRPTSRGGFLGSPVGIPKDGLNLQDSPDNWFEQPLNHFDQSDTRTWKQRYFESNSYYKPGGPLFVQIGGEGAANHKWLTFGAWIDYAKTYNAYIAMVEHRFYGDSHPTSDMSTENLKYLSSEQALADLSNVISFLKKKLNNPKVIVIGGSYSGALAAWFRMKYPHLADGAIASSAPVLAKLDFKEYLEVVDASLATTGSSCDAAISLANALLAHYIKSAEGRDLMKKKFNLCSDIDPTNQRDIANLFNTLAGNVVEIVQYNKDNREPGRAFNPTIDTVCNIMGNTTLMSPLARYAELSAMLAGGECVEFKYAPMIKDLQDVSWSGSAAVGGRQWMYQTCTEFAYYQSTDSMAQPFGQKFPLQFFIDQCTDIFGSEFTEARIGRSVNETNIHYGGAIPKVTRVIFPNGSIDPWHALGVLKDLSPEATAIYIKGTAHCANMYPSSPQDPPGLTRAREIIRKTIGMWLE